MAIGASRSLGDERPQRVGAALGDHMPELGGPMRLVAELLAPRPEAARRMVQRVLVGKPHRALRLVGDRRASPGRLASEVAIAKLRVGEAAGTGALPSP